MTYIALLTTEEFEEEQDYADATLDDPDRWHENLSAKGKAVETFDFGEIDYHFFSAILAEINSLKPKVDSVAALLEFLFLQSSESQQVDMFLRFVSANLAQDKIVIFYEDKSGLISA